MAWFGVVNGLIFVAWAAIAASRTDPFIRGLCTAVAAVNLIAFIGFATGGRP